MSRGSAPPASVVPHNRWRGAIRPPVFGRWEANRTVSVVVSGHGCQDALALTFASLTHQTYPRGLTQVVAVDDGSRSPLRWPEVPGDLQFVAVRQDDAGAGRAQAWNAGAAAADGEILVFLDADAIPAPWLVEAHTRWHHLARDLVTLGRHLHLDATGLEVKELVLAARRGRFAAMDALLAGRESRGEPRAEEFLDSTRMLTVGRPDLFRIFAAVADVAMARDLYREVGGMRPFSADGVEALDFGYRLQNAGAVLVPEPRAVAWRQERSGEARAARQPDCPQRDPAPLLADRVPLGGFRSRSAGRVHAVPSLKVVVPAGDASGGRVVDVVEAALATDGLDVSVMVRLPPGHPDEQVLEDSFAADFRVDIEVGADRPAHELAGDTPAFVILPPQAAPGRSTLHSAFNEVTGAKIGALHLTIPGCHPRTAMVHAYATGAARRAARVAADTDGDWEVTLGSVFGEAWRSGAELGLRSADDAPGVRG